MSQKRFDKDIELAKVQAKVTEYQTGFFSQLVGIGSIGIVAFIALMNSYMQTSWVWFFIGAMLFGSIVIVMCYWLIRTDWQPHMIEIRMDFEKVYHKERVEY